MEKSGANNFLILFRDSGCQFRSLYTYSPETEEINKLSGIGPKTISRKMIDGLYKYNSDRKQFSQIPAKTMSANPPVADQKTRNAEEMFPDAGCNLNALVCT
ncbi:hypothetical protein M9458_043891 [Cirrhinus mrigala]|uniref:CKK domain-containing protein n=1 Tax=Cirrhinus mrigala TaxID=683832 RepID=A0ABD0NG11_CIRMR